MSGRSLLLAAGGTGGHLFPAQALAETMLARGWQVALSTDARGSHYVGGFPEAVKVEIVSSGTPSGRSLPRRIAAPFLVGAGVAAAILRMRRQPPSVVVGFGGYPSVPALAAATSLRLPRMIHEQNGVLGRVNQLFAPRVHRIACGIWPTDLPDGIEGVPVGNPVRAAIRARAGAPYIAPGEHPMDILVTGGSQGARILSDIVPPAIAELPRELRARLRVSHQARAEDVERVAAFYDEALVRAEVVPFFTDMADRIAAAQLVIARSGASTVADLSVIGRPSILVPLAAALRDEQTANARGLVMAGAAEVVAEGDLRPDELSARIAALLADPARAAAMARAALAQGRPDAADTLADLVEEVAGMNKEQGT